MNKHTATYEGHTVTRNSKSRVYTHAILRVTNTGDPIATVKCYGWTTKPDQMSREARRHGGALVVAVPATVTVTTPRTFDAAAAGYRTGPTTTRGGTRPGAGRKPSADGAHDVNITVRLTSDQAAALDAKARELGITRSELLRERAACPDHEQRAAAAAPHPVDTPGRKCGECLMNTVDVVTLHPVTGVCPKCGADYGPDERDTPAPGPIAVSRTLLCAAGPTSCHHAVGCLEPTSGRLYCGPHALELGVPFRVLSPGDLATLRAGASLAEILRLTEAL